MATIANTNSSENPGTQENTANPGGKQTPDTHHEGDAMKANDMHQTANLTTEDLPQNERAIEDQQIEPRQIFDHLEQTDPERTIYLKFDQAIEVATAKSEQGIFLEAALARVPWKVHEQLGNAAWTILQQAMRLNAFDIQYSFGALMVDGCLYPTAQFKIAEGREFSEGFDSEDVQAQISECVQLLGDHNLWRYDLQNIADAKTVSNIQIARDARDQITAKALPCGSSMQNKNWTTQIDVPRHIIEKRPLVSQEQQQVYVGHITGCCSSRRHLHFLKHGARAPIDISFDAETFWDLVRENAYRKESVMVELTWVDSLEGATVKSTTLLNFREVEAPLC